MYEKYRQLRDQMGIKDAVVARETGITRSTFTEWKNGRSTPKPEKLKKIAAFFGVSVSEFFDDNPQRNRIPILGRVAAGKPIEMIQDVTGWEEIDEKTASMGDMFALRISGRSMEPRIQDGDIVIVHKQEDAESGEVVIASVNGDDATCKILRKYNSGIELIPINPTYKPMFFSNEEIQNLHVTIIGRVIELRAKL